MSEASFNQYATYWLIPGGSVSHRDIIVSYRAFYNQYWSQYEQREGAELKDDDIIKLLEAWNNKYPKAEFKNKKFIGVQLRQREGESNGKNGKKVMTVKSESSTSNNEDVDNSESDIFKIHLQMEKEVDDVLDFMFNENDAKSRGINKSDRQYDGHQSLLGRYEKNGICDVIDGKTENIITDDEYHNNDFMDIDESMYSDSENSMEDEMGRLNMITEHLRQDIESQNHGSMMDLLGQLVSDDEDSVASVCSFKDENASVDNIISCAKEVKNVRRKGNKNPWRHIVPSKLKPTNTKNESISSRRKARSEEKKNRSPKKDEEAQILQEAQHQSSTIEIPAVAKNGLLNRFDSVTIVLNILLWLIVSRFVIHSTDSLMNSEGMPMYD